MLTPGVKKFGKRVLQIGLPVVILALFLYQVKKNWAELTAQTFQWNAGCWPWPFLASCYKNCRMA